MLALDPVKHEAERGVAKMELIAITKMLMPGGKPKYLEVRQYPAISELQAEYGDSTIQKVLFLMVQDFCLSLNMAHNMNEDQMIETASMMLDECDTFRIEDYQIMFAQAKRGDLVEFKHQCDISTISQIMDKYYEQRAKADLERRRKENEEEKRMFDKIKAEDIPTGEGEYKFTDLVNHLTKEQQEQEERKNQESIIRKKQQQQSFDSLLQYKNDGTEQEELMWAARIKSVKERTLSELRRYKVPEELIEKYWNE